MMNSIRYGRRRQQLLSTRKMQPDTTNGKFQAGNQFGTMWRLGSSPEMQRPTQLGEKEQAGMPCARMWKPTGFRMALTDLLIASLSPLTSSGAARRRY